MPDVTDVLPLNRRIQIYNYADKDLAKLIWVWLVQEMVTVFSIQPGRCPHAHGDSSQEFMWRVKRTCKSNGWRPASITHAGEVAAGITGYKTCDHFSLAGLGPQCEEDL